MYTKARILIVEDEQIAAEYLREVLELSGFEVVDVCDTGAGAIESAVTLKPDIVFMDIMLKDGISGSEAALKITTRIATRIIFLTAYSDAEMIEYALDAGAVNYLIKPPDEQQILAAVQIALRQKDPGKRSIHSGCVDLAEEYCYHHDTGHLYHDGTAVDLGTKSRRVIRYLCENIHTIISSEELSAYVYGEARETSALRTLVSRLRKRFGEGFIQRHSGLGYTIRTAD